MKTGSLESGKVIMEENTLLFGVPADQSINQFLFYFRTTNNVQDNMYILKLNKIGMEKGTCSKTRNRKDMPVESTWDGCMTEKIRVAYV